MTNSKSFPRIILALILGLAGGYFLSTMMTPVVPPPPCDDCACATSSKPFYQIPQDEAQTYTRNYNPDPVIQPTKAILLTNDIIQALSFINDSLNKADVGGKGVRLYFASTTAGDADYNSFVAIGVGDDGKDVPSTNSQNLFVKREPNTTIDPCPIMCDTSSPLNH